MSADGIPRVSLTLPDAVVACGLSERTLRDAIATGDLAVRYGGEKGGKVLIRVADLDAYIDSLPTSRERAS